MSDGAFGRRLKVLLDKKGMSQRQLAEALGVTEVTVSRYCTAMRLPRWLTVHKIAEAIGVETDALLDNEPDDLEDEELAVPEKVIRLGPYEYGRCPGCHSALDTLANPNYCGHCGRQVRWE